jgi:oligoribonuclease
MRYLSIDVETTGLDPARCQMIELAMVLEDSNARPREHVKQLPFFVEQVRYPAYYWEAFALGMHFKGELLNTLVEEAENVPILSDVVKHALEWLSKFDISPASKITVAGKNFAAFDRLFIPPAILECFERRVIDAGSVLIDWREQRLKSLGELSHIEVAHEALDDARTVIEVLRTSYDAACDKDA